MNDDQLEFLSLWIPKAKQCLDDIRNEIAVLEKFLQQSKDIATAMQIFLDGLSEEKHD